MSEDMMNKKDMAVLSDEALDDVAGGGDTFSFHQNLINLGVMTDRDYYSWADQYDDIKKSALKYGVEYTINSGNTPNTYKINGDEATELQVYQYIFGKIKENNPEANVSYVYNNVVYK